MHPPHLDARDSSPSGATDRSPSRRYLGRQYPLRVVEGAEEQVKFTRGRLWVYTADREDTARVAKLVEGWYRRPAGCVFVERMELSLPRFAPHDLPPVTRSIRRMKTRWGSCRALGAITLNLGLVQLPRPYIDYVIANVLCYLARHNHGPRCYALLDRVMPDWQERWRGLNRCEVG